MFTACSTGSGCGERPIPAVQLLIILVVGFTKLDCSGKMKCLAHVEVRTGLHGANRLASNSLLEAVVMAHRGAVAVFLESRKKSISFPDVRTGIPASDEQWFSPGRPR